MPNSYIVDHDWLGASLTLGAGDVLAGRQYNLRKLIIPTGATVTVEPYNGSTYGDLTIEAREVYINGTLDATGAGYGGGGGGGGGGRR